MIKYFLTLICIFLFGLLLADNTDLNSLFEKGNNFYQKSDYEAAAKTYEEIIKQGYESAELYYNLGNTYYKTGKIPNAILFYERAKKLAPNDEDINFNLKIANLQIIDKINPMPEFFLKRWWNNIADLLPANDWAWLAILILFCLLILIIVSLLSYNLGLKKITLFLSAVLFIISCLSFLLARYQYKHLLNKNKAIIFTPSAYVKSSPNEKSIDLFILHEGTKVEINDVLGEWEKIKLINGNIGWVKSHNLEII